MRLNRPAVPEEPPVYASMQADAPSDASRRPTTPRQSGLQRLEEAPPHVLTLLLGGVLSLAPMFVALRPTWLSAVLAAGFGVAGTIAVTEVLRRRAIRSGEAATRTPHQAPLGASGMNGMNAPHAGSAHGVDPFEKRPDDATGAAPNGGSDSEPAMRRRMDPGHGAGQAGMDESFAAAEAPSRKALVPPLSRPSGSASRSLGSRLRGNMVTLLLGVAALLAVAQMGLMVADWVSDDGRHGASTASTREAELAHALTLMDVEQFYLRNAEDAVVFVIAGQVRNTTQTPFAEVFAEAALFDDRGELLLRRRAQVGAALGRTRMRLLPAEELENALARELEYAPAIGPGEAAPFQFIFPEPPEALQEFGVKVVDATRAS